jgi:NTP pyrophosphatase (non-canonical NTP hydrolase)
MVHETTLKSYNDFVRSETRSMVQHDLRPEEVEVQALSNALGGEVGELQNVVKKVISKNVLCHTSDLHDKFVLEAGDVLWYLFRLIQKYGYTIEDVMEANVRKLTEKYNNGGDPWRKV